MLDFGLVSVLTIYCGSKLYEKYKAKKNRKKKGMVNATPKKRSSTKENLKLVKSQASEEEKRATHYLKTSGGALALSFLTSTFPLMNLPCLGILGYSCVPNLEKAEKDLFQNRKLGHDVLNAIAFLGCVGFGYYALAAFNCCSINFTYKMVERTRDGSKKMLTEVFEKKVDSVWVLREGVEINVPIMTIRRHDIVIISSGEAVPIDGTVTKGAATIDQHLLTGESVPCEKEVGDHVFAGTLMLGGHIEVSVERAGDETTASKLGKILEQTTEFKTRHYLKGEEWVDKMSVPILCMSGLLFPVVGLSSSFALIKSYPGGCARVSTSLHTLNHLVLSSRKGILVKDGRALEGLTEVDTILFDKTGTLTEDQPEVGRIIQCHEGYQTEDILRYAVIAEQKVMHPIAKAVCKKAEQLKLTMPEIEDSQYDIGNGITVNLTHETLHVGSLRFMEKQGLDISELIQDEMVRINNQGHSFIMVAVNHQIIGLLEIRSQIRSGVREIVSNLRRLGIREIAIVSGDHRYPTERLAEYLGMDKYFYNVLPEDKARIVEQLQNEGKTVCFVGDGINDAIAMKRAHVSVSLRGASSVATDLAQVVLMDGTLTHLCDIFDLSTQLDVKQRQCLSFVGVSWATIAGCVLFLGWGMTPVFLLLPMIKLLGLFHAMLPLRQLPGNSLWEKYLALRKPPDPPLPP